MKKLMILAVAASFAFAATSCKKTSTTASACSCTTTDTNADSVRAVFIFDSIQKIATTSLTGDALTAACNGNNTAIKAYVSTATCTVE